VDFVRMLHDLIEVTFHCEGFQEGQISPYSMVWGAC
jgi:hypothetical protein